jgi:hypothetical protein
MDELIQNDGEVLDRVFEKITARPDFNINTASQVEQVVVLVTTAQGLIDNGGFAYFFENDFEGKPDYQLFVNAFDAIGATESAQAFREALALFPNGKPQNDLIERNRWIDEFLRPDFEDEQGEIYRRIENIEDKILGREENYSLVAQFIRDNWTEFNL